MRSFGKLYRRHSYPEERRERLRNHSLQEERACRDSYADPTGETQRPEPADEAGAGSAGDIAARPPEGHSVEDGLAVAGTFSWIPKLVVRASP